ncbi:response regulator [Aliiroseovarius sp.]|uniref:response regulator n=1 Tax=Aliiroseovarius sp. TaxID=1872442 RepID=UPI003BAA16E6
MAQRLYIADDNVDFANYIATVAQREGWQVEICANGRVLLDKLAASEGPAFLLIDVNMPEMDGIEAIEGLAALARPLRLRFITGGSDTSIRAAKVIAEANHLAVGSNIYKPLPLEALKDVLRSEAKELEALAE